MTTQEIEKMLQASGWELETVQHLLGKPAHRAIQGPFVTPWRASAEMVLADVRAMSELPENCNDDPHEGRNEDDARIQER